MEKKAELNLLEMHFFELQESPIVSSLNAHNLRSLSCTSRFFSSNLQGELKKKPIWQIIAGHEQTIFFNKQTGELYGVGANSYNSLGIPTFPVDFIHKIPLNEQIQPVEIFVGAYQTFILSKDGSLYASGRNSARELGKVNTQYEVEFRKVLFDKIKSVAVMHTTTLFLNADNNIYSTRHGNLEVPPKPIKRIEAGYNHVYVLCNDMTLYSYCASGNNQLKLMNIPENIEIKTMKAKGFFVVILTKDNQLYLMNRNNESEFKLLSLPEGLEIKSVHLGFEHIIIQSTNNKLFGYGDNSSGELGLGENKPNVNSFEEICLPTESRVCYVVTGCTYTFVICENDEIYGFGNAYTELGEEKGSRHFLPKRLYLIEEIEKLKKASPSQVSIETGLTIG